MGLLDNFGIDDPETMGLLSAAGNMLATSGPSRMPVSVGQVLASGLQGGMAGYKATQDRVREDTAQKLQQAQLAQALRQGQITQAVYQRLLDRMNGDQGMPAGAQGVPDTGATDMSPSTGQSAPAAPAPARQTIGGGGAFGLDENAMLGGMLAGPAELGKAIVAANSPTDLTKSMRQAGIDPNSPLGRQIAQQNIVKTINIPLVSGRAGAPMFDHLGNIVAMAPKIPDNAVPQIVNGQVVGVNPLSGASDVLQANSYAESAGKAQATPMSAVDERGNPVFTNQLAAARGGSASAPASSSVWQVPPAVQADRDQGRLQILLDELGRTNNPADRASLQREISRLNPRGGAPLSAAVRPAAPPGYAESQSKLASAAADRYNALVSLSSDSPTRVNVYDNILNLSRQGVETGPSADFNNQIKGYVANLPGMDRMFPGLKSDVSNFQEINKFMYQNAQRNWQAAGGTGTDSQLDAFSKANPNSSMFPQALKAMAEWGKAGELALQGKVNAMQNWKDQQGGNVANQDQFERAWRNNFDPILFQLKTMDPSSASQYVANLKKANPNGYSNLMMKAQALKNMGGL